MSLLNPTLDWKYRIWLLGAAAIFTVWLAASWNRALAISLALTYVVLFALTVKKQFFNR